MNLRKIKWLILGTYRPPNQSIDYLFENVGNALDIYSQKCDKFLLCVYLTQNIVNQVCRIFIKT